MAPCGPNGTPSRRVDSIYIFGREMYRKFCRFASPHVSEAPLLLRFALMNASASKGTRSETSTVRSTHHPHRPIDRPFDDGEGARRAGKVHDSEFAVERTRTEDLLMRKHS